MTAVPESFGQPGRLPSRIDTCTTLPLALYLTGRQADVAFIQAMMARLPSLRSRQTARSCHLYGTRADVEAACEEWNEYAKSSLTSCE